MYTPTTQISQWQESYSALEDRNAELEKQVETTLENDELVWGRRHVEAAMETLKDLIGWPPGREISACLNVNQRS
jgi:hypothetical protein